MNKLTIIIILNKKLLYKAYKMNKPSAFSYKLLI